MEEDTEEEIVEEDGIHEVIDDMLATESTENAATATEMVAEEEKDMQLIVRLSLDKIVLGNREGQKAAVKKRKTDSKDPKSKRRPRKRQPRKCSLYCI